MTSSARRVSLTGIKPTGIPHLGNYIGAIRPAIELAETYDACYFIADYHALTTVRDRAELDAYTRSVAASWLACGLDPERVTLYRQSDVPETFELQWVLSCLTAKGLMNRAHAYKAARDRNREAGVEDLDAGVSMGLFEYPLLMAADILVMEADVVPVGRDQVQHVEYTRDIAERFNLAYGDRFAFTLPEHVTAQDEGEHTMPGLDGRKMSKSYDNTIPLFADAKRMRKLVRRMKTDSTPVEEPKDPDSSHLFAVYRQFAGEADREAVRARLLAGGMGWGEMKDLLADRLEEVLGGPRGRYEELMDDRAQLDAILAGGAERARERAGRLLAKVRAAIGIG
ncbi:tryptophan--tRNA ligase [Miltoncostaea marina]|uniref:tryptophan--tRNA ligase n=1 Tax=Miltoncostaea marina TaxID=2843215 RepID=UPI001C3CD440|nr:tryptophan--tRNA ligase [Miltoncostaea marina]